MPDTRTHRGPHPADPEVFASAQWPALRAALADLSWLLDRGYALRSSLVLTGDRRGLTQRQRLAVARCACSQEQLARRDAHRLSPGELAGRELWIDGYNLLITVEAALAGGMVFVGRDGCYRDLASVHGTYREVAETSRALQLVGETAARLGISCCRWYLDQPVGNSGRLKVLLLGLAAEAGWNWTAELAFSPDRILARTEHVVASSDSVVLDRCASWCDIAREIITNSVPGALLIDLNGG